MLSLSATIIGKPVLSLQTGKPIATIIAPLLNPKNLKVEGFFCEDTINRSELILLEQDIREIINNGFVVNDHTTLSEPEELVRLSDIVSIRLELTGKQIRTVSRQKVGRVADYAIETDTMYIQKIYASQSIFKSLMGGSLSIDRGQIQDITPKYIIISELLSTVKIPAPAAIA